MAAFQFDVWVPWLWCRARCLAGVASWHFTEWSAAESHLGFVSWKRKKKSFIGSFGMDSRCRWRLDDWLDWLIRWMKHMGCFFYSQTKKVHRTGGDWFPSPLSRGLVTHLHSGAWMPDAEVVFVIESENNHLQAVSVASFIYRHPQVLPAVCPLAARLSGCLVWICSMSVFADWLQHTNGSLTSPKSVWSLVTRSCVSCTESTALPDSVKQELMLVSVMGVFPAGVRTCHVKYIYIGRQIKQSLKLLWNYIQSCI